MAADGEKLNEAVKQLCGLIASNTAAKVRAFIDKDPELQIHLITQDDWGYWYRSPLHHAVYYGKHSMIKILVEEYCICVNSKYSHENLFGTPLHMAIKSDDSISVRMLMAYGADLAIGGTTTEKNANLYNNTTFFNARHLAWALSKQDVLKILEETIEGNLDLVKINACCFFSFCVQANWRASK